MISHSNWRDQYVYEMLRDKFFAPIAEAQNSIPNTAKNAQDLAEVLGDNDRDSC